MAAAEAPKPEDIAFEHLELVEDAEPEDSLAKTLGLEDVRDDYRRDRDPDPEEISDEEVPDLNNEVT